MMTMVELNFMNFQINRVIGLHIKLLGEKFF